MTPPEAGRSLDAWLDDGDAATADWGGYVLKRALKGELGDGGPGLLLDLPALTQPYACRSAACTPGRRAPRALSCCADLEVTLMASERDAINAAAPEIAAVMTDDPRWATPPALFDGAALRRPGGRCVLACDTPDGLRCSLHAVAEGRGAPLAELKPLPCRLFPLVVVDLGDGRRLLTALHRRTTKHLGAPPTSRLPCLGDGPPLYVSERETITAVFGADVWAALDRRARR